MTAPLKIGVLTGGGDCPGLNPAIRAVVHRATSAGHEVVGLLNGWMGLATAGAPATRPLDRAAVRGIQALGGTMLGSSRTNLLKREGGLEAAEANMRALGLDALIAIGGDDTLSVAAGLAKRGAAVNAIPKTMDNDVWGTEGCLGFDTAANIVTEAIDRIATTTASHHRVAVVEVMGRDAGWVAAWGGLAGGAHAILVPEVAFTAERLEGLVAQLKQRRQSGDGSSIVVVSEGVTLPATPSDSTAVPLDEFGHPRLDKVAVGDALATILEERTGLEVRCTRLGHLQRGGAPTAADRVLGTRYGVAAVAALEAGRLGVMVALKGGAIVEVPLADVGGKNRSIDLDYPPLFEHFD